MTQPFVKVNRSAGRSRVRAAGEKRLTEDPSDRGGSTATPKKGKRGIRQSAGIQSIEIGMSVLDVFNRSSTAMSLKQISDTVGMAPSKVHRYLVSFVRSGMLVQSSANGVYDLGAAASRLGMAALRRLDPFAVASKSLVALRDSTGHSVCLAVWSDAGPMVVRVEPGGSPILLFVRIGSILPLTSSAIGRLFLAHMPRIVVEPVLKQQSDMAGMTLARASLSEEELSKIRRAQSIHVSSTVTAGMDAVAAPIFDANGSLHSVIGLLAPHQSLLGSNATQSYNAVEQTAQLISAELGYHDDALLPPSHPKTTRKGS